MPSFLITDTASTELYTLSLHDALPISSHFGGGFINEVRGYLSTDRSDASGFLELPEGRVQVGSNLSGSVPGRGDRKSTRLNSSHMSISYAVFCLKKKSGVCIL